MYPIYSLLLGGLFCCWEGWGWVGLGVAEVEVPSFVLLLVSLTSLAGFTASGFDCGVAVIEASLVGGGEGFCRGCEADGPVLLSLWLS